MNKLSVDRVKNQELNPSNDQGTLDCPKKICDSHFCAISKNEKKSRILEQDKQISCPPGPALSKQVFKTQKILNS